MSRTDFDGSQTIYSYDVGGKLIKVTRSDGRSLTQGYDSFGRMNSQTDTAYGNLGLTLDGNDRVTREVWSHNSLGTSFSATLDYAWDANSNRTQVSTSGQTIKAGYNTLNQLETLTHPDGSTTRFAYDNAGNRVQVTRADGSTTDYQYNLANQLTAVLHKKADGADIASFVYTLNAAGQRTQVAERMVGVGSPAETVERTVRYQYDAAGKLLQERVAQTAPAVFDSTIDYVYDAVGNRSRRTVSHNGQVATYQYDSHDRLTQSVDSLNGTTTYQWDERGNLVQKASPADTTTYAWTVDNRLAKVSTGAKTVEYGYDSSGRRIKRLVKEGASTTETHYKVDHQRGYSEILVESTKVNSGAWVDTVHVHTPDGLGELIASTSAGVQTQLFSDGLGSVRVAQTAATSHAFSYDAFGIALGATEGMPANAADASATSHRYTGEYADSQTGLLHLRARDYDPQVGRFISMDEHPGANRIPLTLNKYLYGNADPVNTVDPSGNFGLGGMMSAGMNISVSSIARFAVHEMIVDRLAGKIVEGMISSVIKGGTLMPSGNPGLNGFIQALATQCSFTKKNCLVGNKIPVLSTGMELPMHSMHIAASQYGFGNTSSGVGVTSSVLVRGQGSGGRTWYKKMHPCMLGKVGDKLTCDEYPFFSTMNGGLANYNNDTVSLQLLPGWESSRQGGLMSSFYSNAKVTAGKPYFSIGNTLLPSYYIKDRVLRPLK